MRVGLPRHQRQRPRPSLGGRSPHLHQLWTRAVPQPVRMGCNMCVVQKPEDQYRVMFQVKELSRLSRDPAQDLQDPLLASIRRRGVRKRAGLASRGGLVTMGVADCVDGCTQTDISFQNLLAPGRSGRHPCGAPPPPDPPPSPPLPPEPYLFDDLFPEPVYYDPNDYFDAAQHEVDRQDELEYEEVELYKSRQQDKLGLTVCYRTDEEEDLGIYVGEVNPHGIAAIDGRIRKGDRILQINGLDVEDREEAVAILTREDSTNISLLLARPETESDTQLDAEEPDLELLDSSHPLVRKSASGLGVGPGSVDRQHTETSRDSPDLLQTVLSNSQELDSGVGRTDESTRNEESSEHDLLGDDHTSASNTNATNTPGSMRRFFSASLLPSQELRFSTDSLLGLDCLGLDPRDQPEKPYARDAVRMAMPGLTEQECERYKELLEIKCYYERSSTLEGGQGSTREEEEEEEGGGGGGGGVSLDVNRNEKLWPHELALLEEELRHLEFKCRNVLRAQKMQQLRERCRKAWPLEDKSTGTGTGLDIHAAPGRPESCEHALSDINELPERERYEKDGTSAYNTGGGSCRSSALANQRFRPPSSQRDGAGAAGGGGGRANLNHTCLPPRNAAEVGSKVRSQSRDAGGRQGAEVRRHPKERSGGAGADSSPYLAHRPARTRPPRRYLSCTQLRSPSPARDGDPDPEGGASPMSLGSTYEDGGQASADLLLAFPAPVPPASPRMEWKVKIRSDGSRYVAKRPVRDRLLKARAMKIREERSGTTTDDDAVSEMKMGRYWSKEERKQQLLRAREQRRRRELMVQSRLDLLRVQGGQQEAASILELWHRRSTKKRSRRILDNWITIQELLAHGSRSADGKKVYNPLLSVTTV